MALSFHLDSRLPGGKGPVLPSPPSTSSAESHTARRGIVRWTNAIWSRWKHQGHVLLPATADANASGVSMKNEDWRRRTQLWQRAPGRPHHTPAQSIVNAENYEQSATASRNRLSSPETMGDSDRGSGTKSFGSWHVRAEEIQENLSGKF